MSRPRRDPRAERAASQVAAGARPRFDRAPGATASRRPRRDPRADSAAQTATAGARPRLDRSQRMLVSRDPPANAPREIAAPPRIIVVDAPNFFVAVVPDAPGGRLTPHDRQLIGAARLLARDDGAVVVLAPTPLEDPGRAGADRCLTFACDPATYDPAARAARVATRLRAIAARHVLFAETPDGGDLARRVALALREPLFTRCEALSATSVSRASAGRRIEQRAAPPRLIALLPDAVGLYGGDPREARVLDDPATDEAASHSAILETEEIAPDPARVPLALADFVTAAGNGVADLETFRALVAALNATPGASRMLCDAGLMPREAQVGASGTVLSATCYFALGIAGAPQHLQGVADCEHVVAVNTDLHAAMIARAGLSIVQDAGLVMPALLDALKRDAAAS